ncbi:hypothetical protein ABT336_18580 [Micromonospora sp. NPDC000207]|uniref:hypothetical protein n=1 Tax=Micromonospora sp. NPDC000207 TaxID=3154246 RepID=UPI003322FF37
MTTVRMQLGQHLLDRQIVDADGLLVGKIDDIEFAVADDGTVFVDALLTGTGVLGQRIGGVVGRLLIRVADRLRDRQPSAVRIRYPLVERVDSAVRLRVRLDELPPAPLEEYLRRRLIDRIPGSDRASG